MGRPSVGGRLCKGPYQILQSLQLSLVHAQCPGTPGSSISRKIRPGESLPGHPLRLEGHRPCTSDSLPSSSHSGVLMGPQYHTLRAALWGTLWGHPPSHQPCSPTSQGEMKGEPALWLCLPRGVSWLQTVLLIRPQLLLLWEGLKTQILNIGTSPLLCPANISTFVESTNSIIPSPFFWLCWWEFCCLQ